MLNPATPAKMLDYLIDMVDLVLVMSVNPGFGGQSFIDSQLKKIAAIRKMIDHSGRAIDLEVDGGVDATHARRCVEAGPMRWSLAPRPSVAGRPATPPISPRCGADARMSDLSPHRHPVTPLDGPDAPMGSRRASA